MVTIKRNKDDRSWNLLYNVVTGTKEGLRVSLTLTSKRYYMSKRMSQNHPSEVVRSF